MIGANDSNDIIDYTDSEDDHEDLPFVKIDSKSWKKRRYWREADFDSDYESSNSVESYSNNKYDALCCWCVDDDDNDVDSEDQDDDLSQVSDSSDTEVQLTETQKAEEADNILSYEEQIQMELQEHDVHDIVVSNHDSPQESVNVIDQIERSYRFFVENPEVGNNLINVDIENAYLHSSMDSFDSDNDNSYDTIVDDDTDANDGDSSDGQVNGIDNDQDDDNVSGDHTHQDSDETHIETLSPEDEMTAAEGDDDLADNKFLTMEEWREVVRTVEFGRESELVADDSSIDDEAAYPVDDETQDKDMIDESI